MNPPSSLLLQREAKEVSIPDVVLSGSVPHRSTLSRVSILIVPKVTTFSLRIASLSVSGYTRKVRDSTSQLSLLFQRCSLRKIHDPNFSGLSSISFIVTPKWEIPAIVESL